MDSPLEWRWVVGYEGLYEVSEAGDVRSLPRQGTYGRTLKPALTQGYPTVCLRRKCKGRMRRIHILVAEAFIGPRPDGHEVRHFNGDPLDARLENLAYGTPSQNQYDRVRHGRNHHANKTHCDAGHEFTEANTYRRPSRPTLRDCRKCVNRRSREYKERKRGPGRPNNA